MKDEYDFSKAERGKFFRKDAVVTCKQMFELVDVIRVEPHGGYRLGVVFSDGTEGERDFSDLIAEGGEMVEPLRHPVFFSRVFLDDGILTWPNGFDLDSIALHMEMKERGLLRRTAT
jgi:Protein of unknown function (DUF2442)